MTTTDAGASAGIRRSHAYGDELAGFDGVATAQAVRSGALSASEVVRAAIARARAVEPAVHAMVVDDFDRAQAAGDAGRTGAFAGVPTVIKDMTDVAGLPTRNGSAAFSRAGPAEETGALAAQLFDMGMVGLGKSTMPEFGFIPCAEFPDLEATRNPWNLNRSTGGSSGGSAALVAAGVVPIAHGADGGGSIRIPAACCGLVGLKATRGRLAKPPESRLMPVDVEVEGVLSRTVRDTALFFAEAERRHRSRRLPPVGHVTRPLVRRLRVGTVLESPNGALVDAPTRAAFERAVTLLESLGHEVRPVDFPAGRQFADDFIQYWSTLAYAVSVQGHRLFDPTFDRSQLTQLTQGLAERCRRNLARTPGAVYRLRRSAADYAKAIAGVDVVLSPVVNTIAPEIGHLAMDLPFDEVFPRAEAWVGYTPLANATGAPAISLPLHHDEASGLPVGMMFSAAHGQDALLLGLALALEEAAPWPTLGGSLAPR